VRDFMVDEAIYRELSERDYGIDGVIEFFDPDGTLSGEEILVQIKGSRNIASKDGIVKTPPIRTKTAKYWLSKRQSVFILFVDVTTRTIYFGNAKSLAMSNAEQINSQKTVSFHINASHAINSKDLTLLRRQAFFSDNFDQARTELSRVILSSMDIHRKLAAISGRDPCMVIEDNDWRIEWLDDLSSSLRRCWYFFEIDARVNKFSNFADLSYDAWGQEYVEMHITETANHLKEQLRLLMAVVVATREIYLKLWTYTDKRISNRLSDSDALNLIRAVARDSAGVNRS